MNSIKGKKAYNNGEKVIYLSETDEIPYGFVKGGLSTRTPEQIQQIAIKSKNTQQKHWQEKSEEEKAAWTIKCKQAQLNMSDESIANKYTKYKETLSKKSIEEINAINIKRSNSCKDFWNNLQPNIKQQMINKSLLNGAGWNKNTIQKTLLSKYNITNISQLSNVKIKSKQSIMKSNFNKYGFYWNCLLPQCMTAIGSKSCHTKPNELFAKLLDDNNISYTREFVINHKSYDFKINNILIEINPFATHNSTWSIFNKSKGIDKSYHFNKSQLANSNNYRCIHVFDWDNPKKIISILKTREKLYARNCVIKAVSLNDTIDYINTYHLQGYAKDTIRLGLYNNNELVSIMTFGKSRYNRNYEYELIRYCSHKYVIGGAEKLFKYFISNYNPNSIISYCDKSKFDGNIYTKLGFIFNDIKISKHWYNPKTKQHILNSLLLKLGYDKLFKTNYGKGTSNEQLMLDNGFVEIYDAGQASYIWSK